MGTKERRQREYNDREKLLLDTALGQVQRHGVLSLQMGRIAAEAEYSVGTLYQHFESKEDLLLTLVTRSFRNYVELVREAAAWKAPSRERMFAVAVADCEFTCRHPDYSRMAQYALCEVSWGATSARRRREFLEAIAPLREIICNVVEDARRVGDLSEAGPPAQEVALGVWALCRGHQDLGREQLMAAATNTDPDLVQCRHLAVLLDGYRWKPMSDPGNPVALDVLICRVRSQAFGDPSENCRKPD